MEIYDNFVSSKTQSGSSLLAPLFTSLCFRCTGEGLMDFR